MERFDFANNFTVHCGDVLDVLKTLPDDFIHCCVTSPPYYGLRDYGVDGQIGLEETPEKYVARLVEVFSEVRRILKPDGTLWVNIGDSYARGFGGGSPGSKSSTNVGSYQNRKVGRLADGLKGKDLIGIPWMLAFALRTDGWYLRSEIIWHKPNPMPESVKDRPTRSHEQIFLLSKSQKYFYDMDAIKEPATGKPGTVDPNQRREFRSVPLYQANRGGHTQEPVKVGGMGTPDDGMKNKRSVWTITPRPFKGAHFAVFPPELPEPCILAGSSLGGVVLDPFSGSGTTGIVAIKHGRSYIGIELNPEYVEVSRKRHASEISIGPSSQASLDCVFDAA